jgi:choline dehydrogenase-like flavoprotein
MRIAVIGSGPAGAAAASTLVAAGCQVDMFEAGTERPRSCSDIAARVLREKRENGRLDLQTLQILRYGKSFSTVLASFASFIGGMAGSNDAQVRKRILGSLYTFENIDTYLPTKNSDPPRAIALGGLSNVWGGACYTFSPGLFDDWPVDYEEMSPFYKAALRFLNVDQIDDGLSSAYPAMGHSSSLQDRNSGSVVEALLKTWTVNEAKIAELGVHFGRSRLAVNFDKSLGCQHCGHCLTGCPVGAIFNAGQPVKQLQSSPLFALFDGAFVLRFETGEDDKLQILALRDGEDKIDIFKGYDKVVLAAGTLSSFRLAAQSLGMENARTNVLDNDMMVLPIFAGVWPERMSGEHRFSLSEGAMNIGLDTPSGDRLHAQFYSLQPHFLGGVGDLISSLPRIPGKIIRALTSRFALAFLYLPGHLSRNTVARVNATGVNEPWELSFTPSDNPASAELFRHAINKIRGGKLMSMLPLRFAAKNTPFGFSGHLAGTLPMVQAPNPAENPASRLTTDRYGRLAGDQRIVVADAAAFPSLPAQNLTLTIVANAMRVAEVLASERPPSTMPKSEPKPL